MAPSPLSLVFLLHILGAVTLAASQVPATELASQYSLSTSTSFPFPTSTLSSVDAQNLIVSQWSLGKGHIQDGQDNIAFVNDPFPNNPPTGAPDVKSPSGPVLQVVYPAGSFSHETGGSQFYNLWNNSDASQFQTMLLSYEVSFDAGFDWVKGGKLPGLRGGLNSTGCSGGLQGTGSDCFTARVMWRMNGAGEVYAYIPTTNGLCSQSDITCNSDFGISIDRGSFNFMAGQWNRITMLVQLNNPSNVANGNIDLYFNDLKAVSQQNLQIRNASKLGVNGLYFSTFFGGEDESWATPNTTHTYFRNFQLWGSNSPSNLTGPSVNWAMSCQSVNIPFIGLLASSVLFLLI